jgi:hypothetical protein
MQFAGNTPISPRSLQRAVISRARWDAVDYRARMNTIQISTHDDIQSSVQLPERRIEDAADLYDDSGDALGPARAILLSMLLGSGLWALILWLIFR